MMNERIQELHKWTYKQIGQISKCYSKRIQQKFATIAQSGRCRCYPKEVSLKSTKDNKLCEMGTAKDTVATCPRNDSTTFLRNE
jgi:hypothetical protein